jgi:hypothetical protein
MEQIAKTIKDFILNDVNAELAGLADQTVTLPAVTADNIIFGTVDLSRYEVPIVVSILPEQQEPDDGYIDGFSDTSVILSLICMHLLELSWINAKKRRIFALFKGRIGAGLFLLSH